jgi:hypothetical protein
MSDLERASESVVDVEVPAAPVVKPAVAQAAAAEPAKQSEEAIPVSALKQRLEQKERSLLKEIGFNDLESAKAAAAELAKLRQERMSEEERAKARIAELEAAAKERDELRADQAELAEAELAKLTEEQRAFIMEAAPRSPAKQLRLIGKLGTVAPQPAVRAAPANTAPAARAPTPTAAEADNVLETYTRLRAKDPEKAALYQLANLDRYLEAVNKARA